MEKLKNFHIQKFDGNNFQLWKFQMEIIFRAEKILDIVDGSTIRPEATEVDKRKMWGENNSRGMLIISTGLEYSQLQVVVACETAAQMWNRLKSVHEQRSSVNKVTLKQQFFSYKMNPNESIAQHISKIESMALALADVEECVTDVDKTNCKDTREFTEQIRRVHKRMGFLRRKETDVRESNLSSP